MLFEAAEEGIRGVYRLEVGTAILARIGLLDTASKGVRDELRAIADAQDGQAAYKLREVDLECLRIVHREWRATQDDANDRWVVLGELVVGQNLAEGIQLAHTTANELCGLRTEIEDNNLLLHIKR